MKYKILDRQAWCAIAKLKDDTRYNLQYVYRDLTSMVATDGHRMHLVTGLPEVKAHFIGADDPDMQFPDYLQVLPKSATGKIAGLKPANMPIKLLKHAVKLLLTVAKEYPVLLSITDTGLLFTHKSSDMPMRV